MLKDNFKCMTPWCNEFNSKRQLYKIKKTRSKTHNRLHICLGCCVKFGINKKINKWEE